MRGLKSPLFVSLSVVDVTATKEMSSVSAITGRSYVFL